MVHHHETTKLLLLRFWMLTFDPVAKCEARVTGAVSVRQHLLLEIDDWLQHGLVLDVSGRNHDAAVHEVSDGVGQILVSLSQEGFQAEDLGQDSTVSQPSFSSAGLCVLLLSSPSQPSELPWLVHSRCSQTHPGWGPPGRRQSGQGPETPAPTPSPQSHSA